MHGVPLHKHETAVINIGIAVCLDYFQLFFSCIVHVYRDARWQKLVTAQNACSS